MKRPAHALGMWVPIDGSKLGQQQLVIRNDLGDQRGAFLCVPHRKLGGWGRNSCLSRQGCVSEQPVCQVEGLLSEGIGIFDNTVLIDQKQSMKHVGGNGNQVVHIEVLSK